MQKNLDEREEHKGRPRGSIGIERKRDEAEGMERE